MNDLMKDPDPKIKRQIMMFSAAELGSLEDVKRYHASGMNIHAENEYMLRAASLNGNFNVVKYLVKQGADISSNDNAAIREAHRSGYKEIARYLERELTIRNIQFNFGKQYSTGEKNGA